MAGIDLAITAGSTFALLGPNGAGKSTTVRILTTLAVPDGGTVRVAGIDALAEPARVRRRIGVVGQRHGSDPQATGRENLELQGTLYGLHGPDLRQRVDAMLERFGIAHAADRPVRTYSGGMQRRLDVAMGLMHDPAVLFLDEPTTGLDPEARRDVWRQIVRWPGSAALTHPADDALPGGGGRVRRPGRNHGPRPDRRRGNAGRAQARARGGLDPRPAGGRRGVRGRRDRARRRRRRGRGARRRADAAGPRRRRRSSPHPPCSPPLPTPGSRSPR